MAVGVFTQPSANSVVVQDTESTGNLQIEFSRNEKDFPLNKYCQIIPVDTTTGLYTEVAIEQAGRVFANQHAWPDGSPAPRGLGEAELFRHLDYRTEREVYPITLGNLTVDQAKWDVIAQNMRFMGQRAMTSRTSKVVTALTTSGNYASTHTSAAASVPGVSGNWAAATVANQNIRRSLMHGVNIIEQDTLAAVNVDKMSLVLSPALAAVMSASGEIADYLKSSRYSGPVLTGDWAGMNTRGLPEYLYGVKVIVENTVQTTSRRGATAAKSYLMGNASAALVSRIGGLEAPNGPTFSTVSLLVHRSDDMTVEKFTSDIDRTTTGRVVDNTVAKMTAAVSGFLFTSCQ